MPSAPTRNGAASCAGCGQSSRTRRERARRRRLTSLPPPATTEWPCRHRALVPGPEDVPAQLAAVRGSVRANRFTQGRPDRRQRLREFHRGTHRQSRTAPRQPRGTGVVGALSVRWGDTMARTVTRVDAAINPTVASLARPGCLGRCVSGTPPLPCENRKLIFRFSGLGPSTLMPRPDYWRR